MSEKTNKKKGKPQKTDDSSFISDMLCSTDGMLRTHTGSNTSNMSGDSILDGVGQMLTSAKEAIGEHSGEILEGVGTAVSNAVGGIVGAIGDAISNIDIDF